MNELQIFNNPKFGQVRTIEEKGAMQFCGKDVVTALGYKDATNASVSPYRLRWRRCR